MWRSLNAEFNQYTKYMSRKRFKPASFLKLCLNNYLRENLKIVDFIHEDLLKKQCQITQKLLKETKSKCLIYFEHLIQPKTETTS